MSLFLIPSSLDSAYVKQGSRSAAHHQSHPVSFAPVGRCNSQLASVPLAAALHGDMGPFAFDDDAFEARLRYQQQQDEQRVRQHYASLRRQAAEREREVQRRRIQKHFEAQEQRRRQEAQAEAEAYAIAKAAAAALAAEQQERRQRAAHAEHLRRRREWEAVQRQRYLAAQQQQQREQEQRRLRQRQAAAAAAAAQEWQPFMIDGIAGALDFATKFFDALTGDEEEQDEPMQVEKEQQKEQAVASNDEAAEAQDEHADPADVYPEASTSGPVESKEEQAKAQDEKPEQKLVFSHLLPKAVDQRASLKADDIHVSFDEATRTIQISGLWSNDQPTQEAASQRADSHTVTSDDEDGAASVSSHGSNGSRKSRGRSPAKRPRVSDVDEKTGEEIEVAQEDEEDFVKVPSSPAPRSATASVVVPQDADVSNLRAELTDDGFQLYL